jgi:hypothetical protein
MQTGRVMTMLERGQVKVDLSQVSRQIYHLEGAVNRILGGFVFVTFLLAGTLLYRDGELTLSYVFWGLSGISLLWTLFLARGHAPPGG